MPRKVSPRQILFDSLLEQDSQLDPRVVLITDPRWPQALRDLATTPYCGLDTEFFDDAASSGGDVDDCADETTKKGIDPWTCTLRLIQVALPSGLVVVADLGGVGDDRKVRARFYGDHGEFEVVTVDGETATVPMYQPGSFFDVVRDLVESETRPKILHHAKIDALLLRIRMGWRLRAARCTMLMSQLYWAGIKFTRHGLGAVSERAVAAQAPSVWLVEKRLQKSEWRWRLSAAQLSYGALDAAVVIPLFKWLGGLINDAGMTRAAQAECAAISGFVDCEFTGQPVNPAMLDDHIEMWRRGRELSIQPFLKRYPGVDPAKTQVVAVALSLDNCYGGFVFYELDEAKSRRQPVHILGQRFDYAFKTKQDRYADENDHSVAEAVLTKWSKLPWVSALLDWRSMGVVLKWLESIRRRLHRDSRVRGEYAQIAGGEGRDSDSDAGKGMGRSSCRAPSLQQSANPQPKLSRLIHQAMNFTGDVVSMSPRLPFVSHDETAAGYLRWAVARLKGLTPDPFQVVPGGSIDSGGIQRQGGTAEHPASVVEGDLDDVESGNEDEDEAVTPQQQHDVAPKIAWYEELIAAWELSPRQLVVADFSQAHMRIAAQASQDPQLLEDFQQDRDAHLKLAYDFGVATGQVSTDLPIEAFFAWYDKKHPKHKFVKQSLRQPAKTGNYTFLNQGSVNRVKQAGDTAKPPVLLSYEQWEIIREAWRKRYAGLLSFQKAHVHRCNTVDVVVDGQHYGAACELTAGGRLWLKKDPDKFDRGEAKWCPDCGRTHNRLKVKGTDAVAFVWMRTEASAIKYAMGGVVADFDRHDAYFMARGIHPRGAVWGAGLGVMCHDEVDATSRKHCGLAVAECVRRQFAAGLRWAGLRNVPPEPGDAKDKDLIVGCWAEK